MGLREKRRAKSSVRRPRRRYDLPMPQLPVHSQGEFPEENDLALAIAIGRRRDLEGRRESLTAGERLSGAIARGLVA